MAVDRDFVRHRIRRKLARLTPRELMPWKHDLDKHGRSITRRKVHQPEWEEYRERKYAFFASGQNHPSLFRRPRATAAVFDDIAPPIPAGILDTFVIWREWVTDEERSALLPLAKEALVIALEAGLRAGRTKKLFSRNLLFEALAAAFSEHYLYCPVKVVRDMSEATIKRVRRDLLLNDLNLPELWRFIVGQWSHGDRCQNPLFIVTKSKLVGYHITPKATKVTERIAELLETDPDALTPGLRVFPAYDSLPPSPTRRSDFCAEVAYNIVEVTERSAKIIEEQEAVRLLFDVRAFLQDYEELDQLIPSLSTDLATKYGIYTDIPDQKRRIFVKGKRGGFRAEETWSLLEEHVFCRALEEGLHALGNDEHLKPDVRAIHEKDRQKWDGHLARYLRWQEETWKENKPKRFYAETSMPTVEQIIAASLQSKAWSMEARERLGEYDRAQQKLRQWWAAYHQLKDAWDEKAIRSGFCRTVNRRYQPLHFWPTYVSAKPIVPEGEEKPQLGSEASFESYRRRWFRVRDPKTDATIPLVGIDVSSSQTQILAHLLGSEQLRRVTKGYLARVAWQRHQNPADAFRLEEGKDPYRGPDDRRLQELVKILWMRVIYGSEVYTVVCDQQEDIKTFGPGWDVENATLFLEEQPEFQELGPFLDLCQRVANIAWERDPYAGVVLTDPFDRSKVCWNPVQRVDVTISSSGFKVIASLPGRARGPKKGPTISKKQYAAALSKNGMYPVDLKALERMTAPCLVHMLDACLSSLVMEGIARRGVPEFVGIHDCWLVPEQINFDGKVWDGRDLLVEILKEAAAEWFLRLEVVYQDLNKYLDGELFFGKVVADMYARWQKRKVESYVPVFPTRETPPRQIGESRELTPG